ncbi:MAG TPA: copper chaperone CopZ [Metalysinibacillus sp.]
METITLNVQGMSCGHCVNAVETSVGKIDGVSSVKVDLDTAKVEVAFDDAKTSQQAIADEIEDQGYDVV